MKKTIKVILLFILLSTNLFAKNTNPQHWFYSLTSDYVYYPLCDFIPGDSHFAPISGPIDTAAFRITGSANYYIPFDFGTNWLFDESNLILQSNLELTPVTFKVIEAAIFTPVPFLELEAGFYYGLGWNFGSVINLYSFNEISKEYEKLSTFDNLCYQYWIKGTFMFDTGALIPGEWTHIVMLADFKLFYQGITNLPKKTIYSWQTTLGLTSGWQYDSTIILAYQMPLKLYRAGSMFEFTGYLNPSDYGIHNEQYDGSFTTIYITPFLQFKINSKHTLSFITEFGRRRSFVEPHKKLTEEMNLTKCSSEWFINKIALSWEIIF